MKQWAEKVTSTRGMGRVPTMRIRRSKTQLGLDTWYGLSMLAAIALVIVGVGFSSASAQVVTLMPTEDGAAMGVQPGTATIEVVNESNAKVTFDLSGIPAPIPGTACQMLDTGQSLLSGWITVDMDGPGVADSLVEPWGPPPTMLEDAPGGCVAEYPISRSKFSGGVTPGCYAPRSDVLRWSPITRTTDLFNSGMGGAINPDPNGFVSDQDGDAHATLRTNYDFTGGRQATPLVLNPWFFGSSVPPFHAQCSKINTSPAPPVCVAAGGVLRANSSGFKRIFGTFLQNDHVGPNGEISPSAVPGIGTPGVMHSLGAVNQRAFGRGVIHDIDGPCDNNVVPGTPCGRSDFGMEGGPPGHPASTDSVGLPPGTIKGQRFQIFDSEGRAMIARGVARGISVILHKDCLTHGYIPGNGPGMPQPPPSQGPEGNPFPSDFVEILHGPLP